MKAYTDIEQSKKLAEFLPFESADMFYTSLNRDYPWIWIDKHLMEVDDIPCWSLAALLEIIRNNGRYELQMWEGGYVIETGEFITESYFNPIDTCVDLITYLKEKDWL